MTDDRTRELTSDRDRLLSLTPPWTSLRAIMPLALLLTWAASPAGAWVEETIQQPWLYWRHGDVLPGHIVKASASELSWSAESFAEPLRLNLQSIHMIRFPTGDAPFTVDATGSQTIETRDGNRFFGRIRETTDQIVSIDTLQHGELRIRRDAIGLIANPTSRAHVYSGPKGLRGWSTVTYGRRLAEWEELPGGRLATRMVAAELYRSLPANGSVDIEVEFIWRSNPSFQIRFLTPFAEPTKETVKLETRANNYVIQTLGSNGRFRQLDSIPKDRTKVRFLLRWSQSANQLSVYRGRKYLGKMSVKRGDAKTGPAAIYIKNTGPQLTLSRLEIRAGSTLDMTETDPRQDTILRTDNKSVAGRVTSVSASAVTLTQTDRNVTTLPWSEISEVRFQGLEEDQPATADSVECVFQNGETLRGKIVEATDEQLVIRVPAIENPVTCAFNDLERILIHPKSIPPPRGTPTMSVNGRTLHGHLKPSRDGSLGWMPLHGDQAAALADDIALRINLESMATHDIGTADDDLLYLRSGDVVPCHVLTANEQGLKVASRFSGDALLPHAEVKAVELAAPPIAPIEGFDERWNIQDAARAKLDDSRSIVTFWQPTSIEHPTIMTGCDRLEFRLKRKQFEKLGSFFQVTLHNDENEDRTVPFYFSGEKSFVMGTLGAAFKPIRSDNGEFVVRIQTFPFEVSVNGVSMGVSRQSNRDRGAKWRGVSFALGQGQTRGVHPNRRFPGNQAFLELRDLRMSRVRRPAISHTTMAMDTIPLLTVPRDRDSEDLTHLAVGTNNDVVRGRLLALDGESVEITTKSTNRHLPRRALSGIIWLENQTVETQSSRLTRVVLRDTTTVGIMSPRLTDDHLEGDHPLFGAFRIGLDEIQTMLLGSSPNQFHRHDFLRWTAVAAKQPNFDAQADLTSELIGLEPRVDLEMVGSTDRFRISDYNGRVVVLEFWAAWCSPCIKTMPKLLETVGQYAPSQVSLVAVNQGEPRAVVEKFLADKGWKITTALDPGNQTSGLFKVGNLPQTVVIDQSGVVTAVFAGAEPEFPTKLKAAIDHLLKDHL